MPFSPDMPPSQHRHVFTNLEALQTLPWVFRRLHYIGMTDIILGGWQLIQPHFPSGQGVELKVHASHPLITWLVPLTASPHP